MRVEIARLHTELGATMIYVTHDQVEAMTLADKIVVLRAGRIEQVGAPLDLYRDPDNKFVAGFIGSPAMNFFDGIVAGGAVSVAGLSMTVAASVALPSEGTPVSVGIRPNHITIDETGNSHSVDLTESLGGVSYVYLTAQDGSRLIVEARDDEPVKPGAKVGLAIDAEQAMFFDAETEMRLR
jgi:lactose/L-arabinose transport system ATP-binding protein